MTTKVVAVAIGALVVAACASAAPRGSQGVIVFSADRAPLAYGEIYRVGTDGARVDLSNSPAADVDPVLSPDGSLVAFGSNRGGRAALYVVRSDGTGLRRISPLFGHGTEAQGVGAQIAWTRDGKRLAADLTGYGGMSVLWIGDLAGHGRVVGHTQLQAPTWSPDGTELAYQPLGSTGGAEVDVVSPAGKLLWSVRGDFDTPSFGWNPAGHLAVGYDKTTSVYDARGRRLDGFRGTDPAWSPDGAQLASVDGKRLQVRRASGGPPVVDVTLPPTSPASSYGPIEWLGNGRLRVTDGDGFAGVDVVHDRPLALPPRYATFSYPAVASSDGNEIAVGIPIPAQESETLNVATFAGATGPALATGAPCTEQPWFQSPQFTPSGKALVYETGCAEPSADLYAVGGTGTGLRRLTNTPVDETQPAWSFDTTRIAYVVQPVANKCDGCPDAIWTMNVDTSGQHAVTTETDGHWDVHPTWSPDNETILFSHETISSTRLWTVPSAGGATSVFPGKGSYPSWGPSRIAVIRPDVAPTLIQTELPNGSGVATVARDSGALLGAVAWSGNGGLAYLRTDNTGRLELVVAGHAPVRLGGLQSPPRGSGLAWSPATANRLAFEGMDAEGVSDVWTVNADGTHLTRVTHGLGAQDGLAWAQ